MISKKKKYYADEIKKFINLYRKNHQNNFNFSSKGVILWLQGDPSLDLKHYCYKRFDYYCSSSSSVVEAADITVISDVFFCNLFKQRLDFNTNKVDEVVIGEGINFNRGVLTDTNWEVVLASISELKDEEVVAENWEFFRNSIWCLILSTFSFFSEKY